MEVLYLHGSPGAGKSTLSGAVAELLREAGLANGIIDMDEISLVYPYPGRSFSRDNLKAIWPNYAAIPDLRLLISGVIADEGELVALRACVPGARFRVCELTAPRAVLEGRTDLRETTEHSRKRLRDYIELYHRRTDLAAIRDFQVSTHDRPVADAAREVIEKAGWQR